MQFAGHEVSVQEEVTSSVVVLELTDLLSVLHCRNSFQLAVPVICFVEPARHAVPEVGLGFNCAGLVESACDAVRLLVLVHDLLPDLRSEEHTSELQSQSNLVCRLLLEKKNSHR